MRILSTIGIKTLDYWERLSIEVGTALENFSIAVVRLNEIFSID
jgi:hypothetical protein